MHPPALLGICLLASAAVVASLTEPPARGLAEVPRTAPGSAQDPTGRKAPLDLSPYPTCSTSECHPRIAEGEFVHGPVAVQHCAGCHAQPDAKKHEFAPIAAAAGTCGTCHELTLRENVHKPVLDGQCIACHDPHASATRALLKTKDEKGTCAQCHEQSEFLDRKFVHGPVAAGACTLCHNPHSSYYPRLLDKKGAESCLSCHSEMEQALKGAKFWHRPVTDDCALCHDAHGSDHPFQLKQEPMALCLDCHEAKREEIESATVFHEALTTKQGCKNCHNTHAARFPKLLDKPVIEICLGCHDKPQQRPDGTLVQPIGKELAESKYLHGPIREGDCSGCHNPHGSQNFRLLRESYPQAFYAPFDLKSYTLCFSCHDAKVFTEANTTTLTNFRNGDQNLHFVHVNKETKGRTCRACHKTHASNLPKHMAEFVPFGGWDIPIEFQSRATGGSCAPGCHKPRAYDYVRALPEYLLPAGEKPKKDEDR